MERKKIIAAETTTIIMYWTLGFECILTESE